MNAPVYVRLSLAEAEAVTLFLADRAALWNRHALDCGVPDPMRLPEALSIAHAAAVQGMATQKPCKPSAKTLQAA
jgi:hypothetical protein